MKKKNKQVFSRKFSETTFNFFLIYEVRLKSIEREAVLTKTNR